MNNFSSYTITEAATSPSAWEEPIGDVATPPPKTNSEKSTSPKLWSSYDNQHFYPCNNVCPCLPAGQYTIESSPQGIYFEKINTLSDELIELPDSVSKQVVQEIEKFWSLKNKFQQYGFLWKRGVLLWGVPGSGKTTTVQIISKKVISRNGISVFVDNPTLGAHGLQLLRTIEPERPIVVIMEDLDAIVERFGESEVLSLLDGELQIDNVLFIATTNYPEELDQRITNRPSRFDIVKNIGMPSAEAREIFLTIKNPRLKQNKEELKKWIDVSEGFSIAHLKELIVAVEIFGSSLEDAVHKLKNMINNLPSSSNAHETKFGFR